MLLALTGYEVGLLAVAAVFVVFALFFALVVPRARPDFPARRLGAFIAVCVGLFAAQITAVLLLSEVGEEHGAEAAETQPGGGTETTPTETTGTETTSTETTATETQPAAGEGDAAAGKEIFTGSAGCSSCHTLADAGATGTIGPNLDQAKPTFELAVERVTNGKSPMPSFKGTLSEQQIKDVAAYVSTAAGG